MGFGESWCFGVLGLGFGVGVLGVWVCLGNLGLIVFGARFGLSLKPLHPVNTNPYTITFLSKTAMETFLKPKNNNNRNSSKTHKTS